MDGVLSSDELAQIDAAAIRIAQQQLTAALVKFANDTLQTMSTDGSQRRPPELNFVPFPTSQPINGGRAHLIAKLADGSLDEQGFVCGMIKVSGNEAWIILRNTATETTGVNARLSWTVTSAGAPTVPNTKNNHRALLRLAAVLAR